MKGGKIMLFIIGLVFIGIGIFLLLTKTKKMPAIITIVAGVIIIIFGFISLFGNKDEAAENPDESSKTTAVSDTTRM